MMVRLLLDRGAQIDAITKVEYCSSPLWHFVTHACLMSSQYLPPPPSVVLPADLLISASSVV